MRPQAPPSITGRMKKFADDTVLVKQMFGEDHAQMTTGAARWAGETKVWFVLIKDDKNQFPNSPLWGDGLEMGTF